MKKETENEQTLFGSCDEGRTFIEQNKSLNGNLHLQRQLRETSMDHDPSFEMTHKTIDSPSMVREDSFNMPKPI